jgi:hypothetical protein
MANVMIDIAAEFVGNKAFKQADTATDKLTKNVKKLAGTLGLAFGTTAVLAYGKAAVRAAADDQRAQQGLALALKNVGLERDAAASEDFIQRLQTEFGIVDDLLRPAYQTLAIATRNTAESQRLLNLSLDISAATGKELSSVTTALSRAYLGNNTALTRLGVGLSKADLQTKSFYDITTDLANTFKGSATQAANTYAGQMAKLNVASENVAETIGIGIIDSLKILSGNTSVEGLATDMETAATNAAAFLTTVSKIISAINKPLLSASGSIASFIEKTAPFVNLIIEGDPSGFMKKKPKPFTTPMTVSGQSQGTGTSSPNRAAQVAATKAAQAQVKATKELTKSTKDQLKIAKAKAIFDIQKIQIQAALQGKISEEERIRLMLLKAIIEENIEDIEKYTRLLNQIQGKVVDLQETLEDVYAMDAGNPFIEWEIGLDGVQRALIEINEQSIELTSTLAQNSLAMGLLGGASFAQALSGARYAAQAAASMGITGSIGGLPPVTGGVSPGGTTINNIDVTVQGTVMSDQDLKQAIIDATNSSASSGNLQIIGSIDRLVAI